MTNKRVFLFKEAKRRKLAELAFPIPDKSTHLSTSKTTKTHRSLSNFFKDLCTCIFADVVSDFKMTESTSAFGMNDALWNSFAIEMRHLIDKVDILQQEWAALSDTLRGCFHTNRSAAGNCSNGGAVLERIEKFILCILANYCGGRQLAG